MPRSEFRGGTRVSTAELLRPRSYRVTQQQIWILLRTDLVSRYSDFRLTLLGATSWLNDNASTWKPCSLLGLHSYEYINVWLLFVRSMVQVSVRTRVILPELRWFSSFSLRKWLDNVPVRHDWFLPHHLEPSDATYSDLLTVSLNKLYMRFSWWWIFRVCYSGLL